MFKGNMLGIGIVLTVILLVPYCIGVYCPHYCRCVVSNGLRHVQCVGKGLISVELDVPRTVQWLELSNNSIYELRDNIFEDLGLEHIMTLNLENNAIQSVGLNAFSGLDKLRFLDLSGNHLYHLPTGLFEKNSNLKYLLLQGNPLRYMTMNQPFIISHSIKVLDLSNCRLNYIPKTAFLSMPQLIKLNISMNHIGSLDLQTFENMTKLTELDLKNNRLFCDSTTADLMSWLEEIKVKVFGSPCEAPPHPALPPGPMMEKLMILENVKPLESEFDDYPLNSPGDCDCSEIDNYKSKPKEIILKSNEAIKTDERKSKQSYNPLFLILAFVNGVIVGIALSLSFWICSRWMKARRSRHDFNTYTTIDYESPPPAYNELF